MKTTTEIKQVNIYAIDGRWYYAAWTADEHDHNDELDSRSEYAARNEVATLFPGATIQTVET